MELSDRNEHFVERFCSDVLSDQQLAQLSLDPTAQREVQARVAAQAEASTQASILAAETARQAQQYEAEGGPGGAGIEPGARCSNPPTVAAARCAVVQTRSRRDTTKPLLFLPNPKQPG